MTPDPGMTLTAYFSTTNGHFLLLRLKPYYFEEGGVRAWMGWLAARAGWLADRAGWLTAWLSLAGWLPMSGAGPGWQRSLSSLSLLAGWPAGWLSWLSWLAVLAGCMDGFAMAQLFSL